MGKIDKEKLSAKVLKCPKCGCTSVFVYEIIEAVSQHKVVNGIWLHNYDNNEYGNGIKTECRCEGCGHKWQSKRGINFDNYYLYHGRL